MTLAEKIIQYRQSHGLSQTDLCIITGIKPPTIFNLEHGKFESPKAIMMLINTLGDEFKEFLVYKKCAVCGQEFLPKTPQHVNCSHECSSAKNRETSRIWAKANYGYEKVINRTNYQRFDWQAVINKPERNYAQFEQESRDQGLSYGENQARERILGETICR